MWTVLHGGVQVMGVDIYHNLTDDAPDDVAVSDAYRKIIDELGDDDGARYAYECDANCRRNDEGTREAVRLLSLEFPDATFTLYTRWSCDDDPEEYVHFRNGLAVIAPVVKLWNSGTRQADYKEPEPCTGCGNRWDCAYGCKVPWRDTPARKLVAPLPDDQKPAGWEVRS